MRLFRLLLGFLALSVGTRAAESPFERLDEALTFSAWDQTFRARLSGTLDLETYQVEQPAPGLVFTDGHTLFNPRLTLFVDARWARILYAFVQVRADRGFDPGSATKRLRLDESVLRFTPWSDGGFVLQAGKFGTVMGNWVPRHGSWDNPFIGAPLPYENVTPISDLGAPLSATALLEPGAGEKYEYNPIIWGPNYASGLAISGTGRGFDFAAEIKNSAPGSRPEAWNLENVGFEAPAYSGRIGFRPDLLWNFGFSGSTSAYLLPAAASTLPPGRSRAAYRQRLLGTDLGFAWHQLQLWAEIYDSRFDVPRIGTVRTQAGYVETKYKITPQLYGAIRINRQVFSSIATDAGRIPWAHDLWRLDAATGFRLTPHAQVKFQASVERAATLQWQPNYALQFTERF